MIHPPCPDRGGRAGAGGEPEVCAHVLKEDLREVLPPPDALARHPRLGLPPHGRPPVRAAHGVPRVTRASNEPSRSLKLCNHLFC